MLLSIFTFSVPSHAAVSYSENLLKNPSFENSTDWAFSGNMFKSSDKSHTGSSSMKCNARGQSVCVSSAPQITVKKNTDYMLSGYVFRSDNSAWAYIDMNDIAGEVQLLDTSKYGEWVYLSGVWNSGDRTSVQVRLVVEPNYTINQHQKEGITGDIWFDDISLKEIKYDAYSETPATLSNNAKSYTMENSDISVKIATDNNREYLQGIVNKDNNYNWINIATEIPLTDNLFGIDLDWKLIDSDFDNTSTLKDTGKESYHSLENKYYCQIDGLILISYWLLYDCGPIYHYSKVYNITGETIYVDSDKVISGDILLKIPQDVTVYSFNRSRFNNGWDGNFTKGVFETKVTQNLFFKSNVENSWLLNSGSLPFEVLQADNHGLYVGYEHSYGDMLMRTQNDKTILKFTATLSDAQESIKREHNEVFLVPPVFYGAYSGTLDDGSNEMKSWFYDHMMTSSLRENENEPLIEFHLPVFSENDLRNYLNSNNLEQYGVELTKMDYYWTVPGNSFDDKLEQQWNPDPSKWPNGMTYGKLVKSYYPSLKTSLYMADTYNGVDIGTKSGQIEQIKALSQRMSDWGIDYWRSDFDLLKPDNYANHEGLMNILDTMIEKNPDFRYEHCSAGGSLKDFATLQRMTFMTMEDSGGALNHRMAFYSNSYMINPVQLKFDMGFDWTSDADSGYINSNREKWTTYNVRTAMMGAMMVQNVGGNLSDIEKRELIKGWKLYKEKQRPILRSGDVYHILPMPDGKNWDGMMFYNDDIEKGSVFLFRDKNIGATDGSSKNIKLKGLDKKAVYSLTFEDRSSQNTTKTGEELMSSGITVTGMNSVYDSEIIWIEKVSSSVEKHIIGDVDMDQMITVMDATQVQRHTAKIVELSGTPLLLADVDTNDNVNVMDATHIQRYLVHLSAEDSKCGEYIEVDVPVVTPTEKPTENISQDEFYVYYKNTDNWSRVLAYYWHPDNTTMTTWPGVEMEHVYDEYFRIAVPKEATMIIFNNGSGIQTNDQTIPAKDYVYRNGQWFPMYY